MGYPKEEAAWIPPKRVLSNKYQRVGSLPGALLVRRAWGGNPCHRMRLYHNTKPDVTPLLVDAQAGRTRLFKQKQGLPPKAPEAYFFSTPFLRLPTKMWHSFMVGMRPNATWIATKVGARNWAAANGEGGELSHFDSRTNIADRVASLNHPPTPRNGPRADTCSLGVAEHPC